MSKRIELSGSVFHRLTVLNRLGSDKWGKTIWECRCDCGNICNAMTSDLKMGKKQSCGCLLREMSKIRVRLIPKRFVDDPVTKHPLYGTWKTMKSRCNNRNTENYSFYGGRGIKVSKEWDAFVQFRDDMFSSWTEAIEKHGKDYVSLERVDNALGYSKGNCVWTTKKNNCNNTRRNVYIELNGITKTITQWARFYKLEPSIVYKRYKVHGWPILKALNIS